MRRPGLAIAAAIWGLMGATLTSVDLPASQWDEYAANVPKTIIELQPFRETTSVQIPSAGGRSATLINLNPRVNAWFLLSIQGSAGGRTPAYHLENPHPKAQALSLGESHPFGIRISVGGRDVDCDLWRDETRAALTQAQASGLPYAPLCDDRLYLRNPVSGTYTHLERVTNFLRDDVSGGEQIVGFVRKQFFADASWKRADPRGPSLRIFLDGRPAAAPITAEFDARRAAHLGIDVGQGAGGLIMGQWYAARGADGIFLSMIQPQALANGSGAARARRASRMRSRGCLRLHGGARSCPIRFGVRHRHRSPRVGWSERTLDSVRDPKLPCPDGIGSVAPLVVNGMVNPPTVETVAATFAGGFKREHGAFHFGALAERNKGSHYGFIEQGVVFSKLQPDLATLFVEDDGTVGMKTWAPGDDAGLSRIKHARQNGVPLIEYDEVSRRSSPGALISSWGPGNWSGSSDERFRTLRAGACLLVNGTSRYLVYGYFSTATPTAMAQVFQAYGCRYAMHLDMNALEHTYFAIYTHEGGRIAVQHLIEGMAEVDRKGGDALAPRFLSFPDDRDFFYLTRKGPPP